MSSFLKKHGRLLFIGLALIFITAIQVSVAGSGGLHLGKIGQIDKTAIQYGYSFDFQTALKDAELLGPASEDEVFDLILSLKPRNRKKLDDLIIKLHDPNSPHFGKWLTPEEYGEKFGTPKADYDRIADWLKASGFKDITEWPNRQQINFRADAGSVRRILGTSINRYGKGEEVFFANVSEPIMPSEFNDAVEYLGGLENYSRSKPTVEWNGSSIRPMFRSGNVTAIAPKDLQRIYNLEAPFASGNDGAGQQIGIVARSDFKKKDVAVFRSQFGLPISKPKKIFPFGPVRNQGGLEEMEVILDVEWAGAAAPGAAIIVVVAPDVFPSLQHFVNKMSAIKLISISFRSCEQRLGERQVMMFHNLYTQAAAQGQSVFVAAGNTGANDCGDGAGRQVNGFASSPNCTAVGGTTVEARFDDMGDAIGFGSESGWVSGGGGGSSIFEKPSYQQNLSSVSDTPQRSIPDVAQMADPVGPGAFIALQGQIRCCIGGTSLATPIWAGFASLITQKVGPLGNFNFKIYAMGEAQAAGSVPPVYNDVVKGNNSANGVMGFSATPGYDRITGWGSFNGKVFLENMR